jgi:hypothetical protein
VVLVTCAILAGVGALSIGLAILEWRRTEPDAFRCTKCGASFTRPPYKRFPRECPHCRARDWAM